MKSQLEEEFINKFYYYYHKQEKFISVEVVVSIWSSDQL